MPIPVPSLPTRAGNFRALVHSRCQPRMVGRPSALASANPGLFERVSTCTRWRPIGRWSASGKLTAGLESTVGDFKVSRDAAARRRVLETFGAETPQKAFSSKGFQYPAAGGSVAAH